MTNAVASSFLAVLPKLNKAELTTTKLKTDERQSSVEKPFSVTGQNRQLGAGIGMWKYLSE